MQQPPPQLTHPSNPQHQGALQCPPAAPGLPTYPGPTHSGPAVRRCARPTLLRSALLLTLLLTLSPWPAPAQEAIREIEHISGDLYRFRNNFHYSVFLVTDEGIIATDPINASAAAWLKTELARRFDQPVRYLIYSHSHGDHISGGEVFADTATVVSHAQAKVEIAENGVPTAMPQETFTKHKVITLGGKRVELHYLGRSHSDNLIVMNFPDEQAVFAVDFVAVRRLPYRDFGDGYLDEWPAALQALEAMDFEILVPGHGSVGRREHVAEARRYLEDLRAAVAKEIDKGATDDEIARTVKMERYRDWEQYKAWGELNVRGMTRHLRQTR